jgi:hypothetical protein
MGQQPYELVEHVRSIQDLKPFPSIPIQCRAAKQILAAGYTLEEAKAAADRMQADNYWHTKGWDLNTFSRNIQRYARDTAPKLIIIASD